MEPIEVIKKSLHDYIININMANTSDWADRSDAAKKCLAHIDNGGVVNIDWIRCNIIFLDVFDSYKHSLKKQIEDGVTTCKDVAHLRAELKLIHTFLVDLNRLHGIG